MAWWRRKSDPWSERERALAERIRSLEEEIRRLEGELQRVRNIGVEEVGPAHPPSQRRLTATAPDPRPTMPPATTRQFPAAGSSGAGVVESPAHTPHLYNEFGQRKYDLPGWWRSLKARWSAAPPPASSELVRLLAAGGAPELRPLRYERRIARNRFLALLTVLVLVVIGILFVLTRAP